MDRRRLLRSLALAGLGVTAGACVTRGGAGDDARQQPRTPPGGPDADDPRPGDLAEPWDRPEVADGTGEADQVPPPEPDDAGEEPSEGAGEEPPEDPGPAARVQVLCREAIELRPAGATEARHRLQRLTLHHTAVALSAASLAPERLRGHQRYHQDQGWPDIAYHYALDLAGNVYELRDPAVPGDTFTDYDTTGHLQVVCEGNFDEQRPTDELLSSLERLLAALAAGHGLAPASLEPHRAYVPTTTCPGGHLRARMDELRAGVGRLVDQQPPSLSLTCGEAARSRVEAIEAG